MPAACSAEPILALDIGGVCLELRQGEVCRELGFPSVEAFSRAHPELWQLAAELETGRMPEDEFLAKAGAALGCSATEMERFWIDMTGGEMPGAGDFVRTAIGLGCRPVFLSDVSPMHYRALLPRLSFADDMHGAVVSYEVGAMKPDAAMYVAMEERFCGGGVPVLYLDDREKNVLAARERGWTAYQFGTFDEALVLLRQRLSGEA
jgi:FMN phosphatase YigB (HAD superfamily)